MENKRESDLKRVMGWLKEKRSITPKEALTFGCYRLGARIWELRHIYGMDITTELIDDEQGDRYAKYVLTEPSLF